MDFSQASILTVCPGGCDYSSIQTAIDAANSGDLIEVDSGIYDEQVVLNKNVTLHGIDTGSGRPMINTLFLCNHPDSAISGIGSALLLGGCPSPDILVYNNTLKGVIQSSPGNTTIIRPIIDFKGNPSYVVEIQANRSVIDPGEGLGLNLFISGAGDVNSSKLRVSIPPYIVQNGIVKYTETDYSGNFAVIEGRIYPNPKLTNSTIFDTSFIIDLNNIYFKNLTGGLANVGEIDHPLLYDPGKYSPPFFIEFTVSGNATGGDHDINIDLFYKKNDSWLVDRQTASIHINQWYENGELQKYVWVALAFGIIASLCAILNYIIAFCKYISKLSKN